jgi:hypothetical protein
MKRPFSQRGEPIPRRKKHYTEKPSGIWTDRPHWVSPLDLAPLHQTLFHKNTVFPGLLCLYFWKLPCHIKLWLNNYCAQDLTQTLHCRVGKVWYFSHPQLTADTPVTEDRLTRESRNQSIWSFWKYQLTSQHMHTFHSKKPAATP